CMVTESDGSAPGKPGFKMVVFPQGPSRGTVGGGDVERRATLVAQDMLARKVPVRTERFVLHQDDVRQGQPTSMICGGTSTIYFELVGTTERALLFGGGHLAQSLAPMLSDLGFSVTVLDNRREYATEDKYPGRATIRIGQYAKLATEAEIDASTYCFIFTHGHKHDYAVIKALLLGGGAGGFPGKYVGMIGSRQKVLQTLDQLEQEGVRKDLLDRVYAPIGLDLGGSSPFEIALSICAEVQVVRYGGAMRHMRDRLR
ncbi:XdhC family protein, partial [Planctomycetota bacterium]